MARTCICGKLPRCFGVTESRICQIHSQAILSIRAYLQRLDPDSP